MHQLIHPNPRERKIARLFLAANLVHRFLGFSWEIFFDGIRKNNIFSRRNNIIFLRILLASLIIIIFQGCSNNEQGEKYDVIIRGGTVFDGTGNAATVTDVAIKGGYIAFVGHLGPERAIHEIDAQKLYVSPGFINIHDHAEIDAVPTAHNMLYQGVTTSIINPDGLGETDIKKQLGELSWHPMAINIGAAIGFNAVWEQVVGVQNRRPSAAELAKMGGLIRTALQDGAWSVSAGLDYKPAYYATQKEVTDVLNAAAPWRTIFPNHERLVPETGFSSTTGMRETIAISDGAHVTPVITHMKLQGHEQGMASQWLSEMRTRVIHNQYIAADVYPYLAGSTALAAVLVPGWAQEGGRNAMLARFQDSQIRTRIASEIENAMIQRFHGAQGVYILDLAQELVEVMATWKVSAGEAVIHLLEQADMQAILRFGSEDDLKQILAFSTAAIACDCGASLKTKLHPRYYGTFPRVLGHYVRDTHLLTWPNAIRKMTGLPATIIGITNRGFLTAGMAADITIFDPNTIQDHATYKLPTQLPTGIRFVLVNGKIVLSDGRITNIAAGQPIYRATYMPSRPETTAIVSLAGSSSIGGKTVQVDITQLASSSTGTGTICFDSTNHQLPIITNTTLGRIQESKGWYDVTGFINSGAYAGKAFELVIDPADPILQKSTVLHLLVDGKSVFQGIFILKDRSKSSPTRRTQASLTNFPFKKVAQEIRRVG